MVAISLEARRTFVVATAGHVDHGKTTLVHALTGVDTDRLAEEKRRGITIELGFAPLFLGDKPGETHTQVSLIDVPGHRRFVPTMIAGATGIDLVVLVVAADEGPMPQTREHAEVCALLGVRRALVALTKIDRVEPQLADLAAAETRAALGDRFEHVVVPCSARHGTGIEVIRHTMASMLGGIEPRDAGPPWLWIDRVLSMRGTGTVVRGTLVRGRVRVGDELAIAGASGARQTRVRGLHVHGAAVTEVAAPTRLALQLAIDAGAVHRGDLVTDASSAPAPTSCLDVALSGGEMKRGARVVVHVGTASLAAKVTRVDGLVEGTQLVRLVLDAPLPVAPDERVLVRGAGLAGGRVLDARPFARMAARLSIARAIYAGEARSALDQLVEAVAPRPLNVGHLAMAASLEQEAKSAIAQRRLLACGTGVVHRRTIQQLALRARERVTKHLSEFPLDRGIPLASLRAELARVSSEEAAELALQAARAQMGADDGGMIAIDGGVVVPSAATRELAPEVRRVAELLTKAGPHGITSGYLCEALGFAPARARAVLAALERSAMAVRAGELWFSRLLLDDVRARIVAHLASARALTVADAKALCGLSRRQAISILEHLDATGVTRRQGDTRILAQETAS